MTASLPGYDSAAVGAYVNAGSRNENEDENGVAHFLEHLMFKGSTTRTALDIATEVEKLGSNVNAYTSHGTTAYYVTGLASTIETSVAILGDVLTDSLFDPVEIDVERGVILQEIKRALDNPGSVAGDLFFRTAYPNQALGRPILGPSSFIEVATRENFVNFVSRCYSAQNMVVVGVGDIDHDDFVAMVGQHFRNLHSGKTPAIQPAEYVGGISTSTDSKFEQITACIGWKSVSALDRRVYAHHMLASALGGGMSSPLFQEVREKRGLVYSVNAGFYSGRDYGTLIMSAGTTADKLNEVILNTCNVFRNAATNITDNDMLRARNQELVGLATIKEKPMRLMGYLAGNLFDFGSIITPDVEKAIIELVRKDDLIEASEMIFASQPTVALVGPIPDTDYLTMIQNEIR
ncbi:unnamed protein product [Sphagnum tenellum]